MIKDRDPADARGGPENHGSLEKRRGPCSLCRMPELCVEKSCNSRLKCDIIFFKNGKEQS